MPVYSLRIGVFPLVDVPTSEQTPNVSVGELTDEEVDTELDGVGISAGYLLCQAFTTGALVLASYCCSTY